jgi:chemotaxis-related protein WspD
LWSTALTNSPPDNLNEIKIGLTQLLARPIKPASLAFNTNALAQTREQSLREEDTILLFRIGGERFALPAKSVLNVFPITKVRKVPHRTRPPFRGLCCYEGAILLTGLLHVVLDMPVDKTANPKLRRMIVIGSEEASWAFEVDAVDSIRKVDPSQFRNAPSTIPKNAASCTNCIIPLDDGDAVLLDPSAIQSIMERSIQ